MKAVAQRVSSATVTVDGDPIGDIGSGLVLLVGVGIGDGEEDVEALAAKILSLRIFPDPQGRMNRSVVAAGGSILVVSQFTLLADVRRGRRPSFSGAAPPESAAPLIERLTGRFAEAGVRVATGRFGASMQVRLVNEGPVTIVLETRDGKLL